MHGRIGAENQKADKNKIRLAAFFNKLLYNAKIQQVILYLQGIIFYNATP